MTPDLNSYDWIVVNSSAGKDSQAMLDYLVELARPAGLMDRVVVVHADLGRVEWPGTKELAKEQAEHYGLPFITVKRRQGDLLTQVRVRGKWPSSKARYCTSDHKRGQVATLFTKLSVNSDHQIRILNCLGMRADESPARAKLAEFDRDDRHSNGRRTVDRWLPIHSWGVDRVWSRIRASGVRWHYAYDLGMPRLSCCFCIFAPFEALLLAGKHNRALLDEYVLVEKETGHDFRQGFKIAEVAAALDAGVEPQKVMDWKM